MTSTGSAFLALWIAMFAMPGMAAQPRVVALDGATTEIVTALGAGRDLVGRDDSSYYPAGVRSLPSVGYQFTLSAEGILSLRPTLVLGRDDVKPQVAVDQVRDAGVRVILFPDRPTVADAQRKIQLIASVLHRTAAGDALVERMTRELRTLHHRIAARKGAPRARVLVLLAVSAQMTLACGPDSGPGAAVDLAGGRNALPGMHGCKQATSEAIVEADPTAIVALTGDGQTSGETSLARIPGIAETLAARANHEYFFDALYVGGFGPRLGRALLGLFDALYSTR